VARWQCIEEAVAREVRSAESEATMTTKDRRGENWRRMLLGVAEPVACGIDLRAPFADDFGHTRAVDAALLAWCRLMSAGGSTDTRDSLVLPHKTGHSAFHVEHPETVTAGTRPEAVDADLWRALVTGAPAEEIDRTLQRARGRERGTWDAGTLVPQAGMALEVWTETDLSAMHGLWWLALRHDRADWRSLLEGAISWHLENIQPDNATNHPWALHLFALRDINAPTGDGAARLHGELMLHNCQIALGRPDRLSALILMDAARAIGTCVNEAEH
jgi:hypothetical protein